MDDGHSRQDRPREREPAFDPAPLIVTLLLDPESQARFDRLRSLHFPPERNFLAAHVTLFHHLPPERADVIAADLAAVSSPTERFTVSATGLHSLGRGTAFRLDSEHLIRLRGTLARRWEDQLTAQDRQGFRPHVTIQNKVTAEAAKRLLGLLSAEFSPFQVTAVGLGLWRYRGGPWDAAGSFAFIGPPADLPERPRR